MPEPISAEARVVLDLLALSKNVLVSGPPATGKTRLLSQVAEAFVGEAWGTDGAATLDLTSNVPIRGAAKAQVFRTVFHQNSKYRDFLTGIAPAVGPGKGGEFQIIEGTLYRAAEFAKQPGARALLIVDEINRGPAVQVFGGSLVAIEADKRLLPDGSAGKMTQFIEIMQPPDGQIVEYALPDQLFILAVQNQADTSVEPIDVAFLRRFEPFRLNPRERELRAFLGLRASAAALPEAPATSADIYEASVQAWVAVNERLRLSRGPDFQVGHGVLMASKPQVDMADAIADVGRAWARVQAHAGEVFFGDARSMAAIFNAREESAGQHPIRLVSKVFDDEPRFVLQALDSWRQEELYEGLRAIARAD
ncbi:MAG: AAA family ATPase [Pseudomonadota bacterium]|nr:AAA family ATPase [Pseudomonadota bacterium]